MCCGTISFCKYQVLIFVGRRRGHVAIVFVFRFGLLFKMPLLSYFVYSKNTPMDQVLRKEGIAVLFICLYMIVNCPQASIFYSTL